MQIDIAVIDLFFRGRSGAERVPRNTHGRRLAARARSARGLLRFWRREAADDPWTNFIAAVRSRIPMPSRAEFDVRCAA